MSGATRNPPARAAPRAGSCLTSLRARPTVTGSAPGTGASPASSSMSGERGTRGVLPMPVTWSLSEAGDLLTVEGAGVVTDEEYFEAHRGFLAATRAPVRAKLALGDWSAVTAMQLSTESIRVAARFVTARRGRTASPRTVRRARN